MNTQPDQPDESDDPAESGVVETKKSQAQNDKNSDTELKHSNKSERENQTKNINQDRGGSVEPSGSSGSSDRESKSIPINRIIRSQNQNISLPQLLKR